MTADAGLGAAHLRGAEGRAQSHSQDHDAHAVAAALRALSGAPRRRTTSGACVRMRASRDAVVVIVVVAVSQVANILLRFVTLLCVSTRL